MIIKEPNREYNLDITDESCGMIAQNTPLAYELPFYVYCAGQVCGRRDMYTKTYYLPGTLFMLTVSGKGLLHYGGQDYTLSAGDVFVLDCTQYHAYETDGEEWTSCYIRFDGAAAKTYLNEINKQGFVVQRCDLSAIKNKADGVIDLCLAGTDTAALEISLLMTGILTALSKIAPQENGLQLTQPVLRAKQFIESYYALPITLEEMAESAQISPFHFSRLFKAQLGLSPHEYLIEVRIANAKRLLLTTQLYVQDICEKVGFGSANVFIRNFKNSVGITPAAFRSKSF